MFPRRGALAYSEPAPEPQRDDIFIEIEFCQKNKHGQDICGDFFRTEKFLDQDRLISVLSDGLGHGLKANILSTMTATMALKFTASDADLLSSAETIMNALPVCRVRNISYATYTIVDIRKQTDISIVEMDNPPFLLIRNGEALTVPFQVVESPALDGRRMKTYTLEACPEDRLVVISDGISQSGIGSPEMKLGWRVEGCKRFVLEQVAADRTISARALAANILEEALKKEVDRRAYDDMTVGVFYFRQPRRMLVLTGPPFHESRDSHFVNVFENFKGRKVVCGGTTSKIVARELKRNIVDHLETTDGDIPPIATMPGADMVTEGLLTLTRVAQLLERGEKSPRRNAATMLLDLLLESDSIMFLVGTKINEAHQDPTHPMDLEIRRNLIKRIADSLERKHLKDVLVRYV
ncbi:serine/threonine-protein phosphatase [Geomonas sp. RF6]|uniref:SpoIIE family protein phosphatase n=1 Tax=Geomonas sp. RF6 TaxID=2897342 RepID=UPI001E2A470D|nr:SpoIIE family protein phosphatase [Geomonas sp. RF6]UFS68536.1 serine/threonine-protein phosphatase [Geomonas sp. RF6]